MKIIKGICGLVLFICLFGIVIAAKLFDAGTVSLGTAILALSVITLIAIIAFMGIRFEGGLGDRKIDFAEFIHQEYISGRITTNLKKKMPMSGNSIGGR